MSDNNLLSRVHFLFHFVGECIFVTLKVQTNRKTEQRQNVNDDDNNGKKFKLVTSLDEQSQPASCVPEY